MDSVGDRAFMCTPRHWPWRRSAGPVSGVALVGEIAKCRSPDREFATYKEAQDDANRIDRVCLLEGATNRQRLLSPDRYEIVNVRTSRGVKQAILISKATQTYPGRSNRSRLIAIA
jgi:hypothetical protein